jgi:hypothetical protein
LAQLHRFIKIRIIGVGAYCIHHFIKIADVLSMNNPAFSVRIQPRPNTKKQSPNKYKYNDDFNRFFHGLS